MFLLLIILLIFSVFISVQGQPIIHFAARTSWSFIHITQRHGSIRTQRTGWPFAELAARSNHRWKSSCTYLMTFSSFFFFILHKINVFFFSFRWVLYPVAHICCTSLVAESSRIVLPFLQPIRIHRSFKITGVCCSNVLLRNVRHVLTKGFFSVFIHGDSDAERFRTIGIIGFLLFTPLLFYNLFRLYRNDFIIHI